MAPALGLLGIRAAARLRALPDRRVIDRLVRGRAWIPVLGVMLAGIVAMQVEVLKYGANIGRSVQQSSQLTTRNEMLRASVATLANDQRIESLAAGMGMVMPAPSAIGFLSPTASSIEQAVANIHPANAVAFLNASSSNGSVATPTNGLSSSNGGVTSLTGTTGSSMGGSANLAGTTGAAAGGTTGATGTMTSAQANGAGAATVTGTTPGAATQTGTVTPVISTGTPVTSTGTPSTTGASTQATTGTGGAQLPVTGTSTGG